VPSVKVASKLTPAEHDARAFSSGGERPAPDSAPTIDVP